MESRLAVLLHLTPWDREVSEAVRISNGIEYRATEGSCVWRLYEALCLKQGIDEGDPFMFTTYFDIHTEEYQRELLTLESPYHLVPRLCNMIALCSDRSIGMARIIWSNDDYKTAKETRIIFDYTFQSEQITWHHGRLPSQEERYSHLLEEYWSVEGRLWEEWSRLSRLANALIYFYYAWRAYHVQQACINLSIALESLFGPRSTTELAHQIAFNVSKFFGKTREEREHLYSTVKRFYAVRSKLVHGEQAKEEKIIEAAEQTFPICAAALRTILTRREVFAQFSEKPKREKLFSDWLFE